MEEKLEKWVSKQDQLKEIEVMHKRRANIMNKKL